jgi:hypothetical protein
MPSKSVRYLVLALFLLSLGGLLLHARLHPLLESMYNWWALGFGVLNVTLVPLLFLRPATAGAAYLLNAATIIAGTVGMAYYSYMNAEGPLTARLFLLESTFPDIVILFAKLPLAHLILDEMRPFMIREGKRGCRQ